MANNPPQPAEGYAADDFLDQILSIPSYAAAPGLTSTDVTSSSENSLQHHHNHHHHHQQQQQYSLFPLGLSLDNGRDDVTPSAARPITGNGGGGLYPPFEQLHSHALRHSAPQPQQAFQGQPTVSTAVTVPQPPAIRPRVRARRGQATDPHSIAERVRRERISERIRALQELVPSCNKTDRAAMLDEILDYVKFLRLQVKVLSMSRLGGASAVAQLVADVPQLPLGSVEGDSGETGNDQHVWDKWSTDETEQEVAKLMEEDVGAAMQFLQSKSLCIMPISLAAMIYPTHQSDEPTSVKPEPAAPS